MNYYITIQHTAYIEADSREEAILEMETRMQQGQIGLHEFEITAEEDE